MPPEHSFTLYCDGASRGNPGPAAYGFVILNNGVPVIEEGARIENTTNNVAEYLALLNGLRKALSSGIMELSVKADSEFMIRQLNGVYKVKAPHIKELYELVQIEIRKFKKITFMHVRREENTIADALANKALDS